MRVAMLTEGTYPHAHGGVSVWCDQLVRGLPEHDFHLHALTASGHEQLAWTLPEHVRAVRTQPLWAAAAPGGRPPAGRRRRRYLHHYEALLAALLDPAAEDGFAESLYRLAELARDGGLPALLRSEDALRVLDRLWAARAHAGGPGASGGPHPDGTPYPEGGPDAPPVTVRDLLAATDLLEHSLRPLTAPWYAPGATPGEEPSLASADLGHAVSGGLAALPGLLAKRFFGTPLLLTEHGVYLRERYLGYRDAPFTRPVRALLLAFFRLLTVETYRAADAITPGNAYNRRWEERCGADPARIRTVYNGVDPADFPPAGPEPAVPTLSWAGRIDPIKDLVTLLQAFALVREGVPGARLRLFGPTPPGNEPYRDRLVALVRDLDLGGAVTFEGRVPRITDAYAAGGVVVLSSVSEGFPYTLIEAMACGRPTVATDVGGVREAVGDTGLVVPPRSPRALADACTVLLRDAGLRGRLGAAARHRAVGMFTVERAVTAFREIYRDLARPTADHADRSGPLTHADRSRPLTHADGPGHGAAPDRAPGREAAADPEGGRNAPRALALPPARPRPARPVAADRPEQPGRPPRTLRTPRFLSGVRAGRASRVHDERGGLEREGGSPE
ncbi:GT4 family glycosyltransferase PelF [Allostreptomyces psammosilenae]|uniref:D-inositol 3-phosphate glycosyltransferase n=1 Tax=Allostreptomyces psammosilenae TaxID=1892865 RepID=A0A853A147_9ACTN|nr:GT4 family glycosyltransferase PelF [Allostreptomyces psammosilenae]NYI08125.1 glycosyltransferase involved in cell wall biosynthesis [Allostreptomyces psammosilenae]